MFATLFKYKKAIIKRKTICKKSKEPSIDAMIQVDKTQPKHIIDTAWNQLLEKLRMNGYKWNEWNALVV